MAATKGSDTKAPQGKNAHDAPKGAHGANDHHGDEEDLVRTPGWLPLLGLGLLVLGALASYLWVYPGTMNASASDGGDAGDASAEASAPTPAPAPRPAPPLPR